MNIATAVANDRQLFVERRSESCKIVRIQPPETFSIYRDGLLCERLVGTNAAAQNRTIALSNCYPCIAPGSLDTSLSHAAGLIEIAACHA